MKNLLFVFIAASFLVLTSCSKENLDLPIAEKTALKADQNSKYQPTNNPQTLIVQQSGIETAELVTLRLQVSEIANTEIANSYLVDFAGSYDFRNVEIAPDQSLKFVDGGGNITILNFSVNDYAGSNGLLEIDFEKGGNNLSGLTLVTAQEIVIEDEIFN